MAEYKILAMVSTYNGDQFIRHKLQNLVAQTRFKDVLVYVYDAASPGNEREIVKEFECHPNIIYYRSLSRTGLYAAWNHCILDTKSRTDYIATCNVDDATSPEYFEKAIERLDNDASIGLVYTPWYVTKTFGQPFPPAGCEGISDPPSTSTCGHFPVWRRELHDRFGMFDERFKIIGDAEWWNRLRYHRAKGATGVEFAKVDGVHGVYLARGEDNLYYAKDPSTGVPLHVEEERLIHRLRYE
jgi:GT2 family glycosyltransferase